MPATLLTSLLPLCAAASISPSLIHWYGSQCWTVFRWTSEHHRHHSRGHWRSQWWQPLCNFMRLWILQEGSGARIVFAGWGATGEWSAGLGRCMAEDSMGVGIGQQQGTLSVTTLLGLLEHNFYSSLYRSARSTDPSIKGGEANMPWCCFVYNIIVYGVPLLLIFQWEVL